MQAVHKGEVDCISAGHGDADLWIFVWSKVGECIDEGYNTRVVWTKAHTTHETKVKMSPGNRQVAWANDKADE